MRRCYMAAALAMALLGTTACASAARDRPVAPVAITPAALSDAVDAAREAPYRFTLSVEVGTDTDDTTQVLHARGAVEEGMVELHADLSALVPERDIPDGLTADDLYVETITGPGVLHARTPLAGVDRLPAYAPADLVEITDAFGDGWVTVDVSAVDGVEPQQAACLLVGVGADPRFLLDVAREATSVEHTAGDEIDGVPVDVLAAEVPLSAVQATGRDDGATPADPALLRDLTVPVEVWVDDEGLAHRVRLTRDLGDVTDALVEAGEAPAAAAVGAQPLVTYTLELSDHGDDAIGVDTPESSTDVSAAFARFVALVNGDLPSGLGGMTDALSELEAMYGDPAAGLDATLPDLGSYPSFEEMYPELADGPPLADTIPPPPPPAGDAPSMEEIEQDLAELDEAYEDMESWDPPPTVDVPPELLEPPAPPPTFDIPEIPEYPSDVYTPGG